MSKLKKWTQERRYEHSDFGNNCKREDCIHCIPPFKLYCFHAHWGMKGYNINELEL